MSLKKNRETDERGKQKFEGRENAEHGYEYVKYLVAAIENYTQIKTKESESVFNYKGCDLRYAIEKYLYFKFYYHKTLFDIFVANANNSLPDRIEVDDEAMLHLVQYIAPGNTTISIKSNLGERLKRKINLTLRNLGIKTLLSKVRFSNSWKYLAKLKERRGNICVYCSHVKFLSNLEEVLSSLDRPVQIITLNTNFNWLTAGTLSVFDLNFLNKVVPIETSNKYLVNHYSVLLYEFATIEKLANILLPSHFVVAEGNKPTDELISQLAKINGINSSCIQQGWATIVHTGFKNMSYSQMLVWGEGFADILAPFNEHQQFVPVGNPWIEEPNSSSLDTKTSIVFFLQNINNLISKQIWDEFFDFILWTAHTFPDFEIVVRAHPDWRIDSEQIAKVEDSSASNIKFKPPQQNSLNETLRNARVSVSIYSSTIMESIGCGVPPLIFNNTSLDRYLPDVDAVGAGVEVSAVEAAQQAITKLVRNDSFYENTLLQSIEFGKSYFKARGGSATQNMIEALRSKPTSI